MKPRKKGWWKRTSWLDLLIEKGIGLKPIDVNPVFNFWNRHLQEDQIRSTPSCVIVHGDLKETHAGGLEVIKALEMLREDFGKKPAGRPKEEKAVNGGKGKDLSNAPPRLRRANRVGNQNNECRTGGGWWGQPE